MEERNNKTTSNTTENWQSELEAAQIREEALVPSKRKREASEDGLGHKVCRPKRGETLLQDAHLWILLALLLGARTLLGAKGIATRSDRTLLGAPGLTTRSKDATNGAVHKLDTSFQPSVPSIETINWKSTAKRPGELSSR